MLLIHQVEHFEPRRVALIVGLDGTGVVGIKLGLTQENIDGGSWGLLGPNLVIVAYPGGKCHSQITLFELSGMLSHGIIFNHLSRSSFSVGKRNTFSRLAGL